MVNFSEQLEAAFSTVVVRDAVGKRVDKADAHLDPADRSTMRVSLPSLAKGTYIVVWRALTADTHRTEGAFIFRVGE
jgi:methionine-rich copper-binding protein CopC